MARVAHVVDGDTLDVTFAHRGRERVRLLGIDTPETVKPRAPVECFGPEASDHTKELLPPGTAVVSGPLVRAVASPFGVTEYRPVVEWYAAV